MPAYNFKAQFAVRVKTGLKKQTIRHKRKRPTTEGDRLYLYTGMRTKKCRKLKEAQCRLISSITIANGAIVVDGRVLLAGSLLAEGFAKSDGFKDAETLIQWFTDTYGLPFQGEVIYW